MSSKETVLENRLTKLEEADKHILQNIQLLTDTCVTKIEHANVMSQISDLQSDLDCYKTETNKKLDGIVVTLNSMSYKIAMYIGGTIVAGSVFGFVVWMAKEIISKWLQG